MESCNPSLSVWLLSHGFQNESVFLPQSLFLHNIPWGPGCLRVGLSTRLQVDNWVKPFICLRTLMPFSGRWLSGVIKDLWGDTFAWLSNDDIWTSKCETPKVSFIFWRGYLLQSSQEAMWLVPLWWIREYSAISDHSLTHSITILPPGTLGFSSLSLLLHGYHLCFY